MTPEDPEVTDGNPTPRKRAAKPKRPEGVQSFKSYWTKDRLINYRAQSPEAYARRAWNRCTTQHTTEIERLKKQIDRLAGDLAGIRFTVTCNENDKRRFHYQHHASMDQRCLDRIKGLLELGV